MRNVDLTPAPGSEPAGTVGPVSELAVLRLVNLKGEVIDSVVGTAFRVDQAVAHDCLRKMVEKGLCLPTGRGGVRLSESGIQRVTQLVEHERDLLRLHDPSAHCAEFENLNAEFKQLVADWQNGVVSSAELTALMAAVHDRLMSILAPMIDCVPRLANYPGRLSEALDRIQNGQTEWIAHPLRDSYHTVWFELHQEFLDLSGSTRTS